MVREQKDSKKELLAPSLAPVKRLSLSFQRKLMKHVDKQRKHFRSSGKPYPLVTMESPSLDTENNDMQGLGFTFLLVLAQID